METPTSPEKDLDILALEIERGASPVVQQLSEHAPLRQPRVQRFGSRAHTNAPLVEPCCGGIPYNVEEDGHNC